MARELWEDRGKKVWLKVSGVIGITAPLIAFTLILLAIAYSPQFSWTENVLSDLGAQEGVTAVLFNSGLIIGGFLALVFALGLFLFLGKKMLGEIGAFLLVLATLALITIGAFPSSNVNPTHYYASVTFFVLLPLSIFVIGTALLLMHEVKIGLFALLVAIIAAVPWIIYLSTRFIPNNAIIETISALSASTWSIISGHKMLKQPSQSNR